MHAVIKLRDDQTEAIQAITAALGTDGTRATAVLPCGYGKTVVAQRAVETLMDGDDSALVLIAAPNLVLVDQIVKDWARNGAPGHGFEALAVNSGGAGREAEEGATGLTVLGSTSDAAAVAEFITRTGRRALFTTYQSMPTIAAAIRRARKAAPDTAFDVIVCDEAHRTAGTARAGQPSAFKRVLDDTAIPGHRRLFLTATPRVASASAEDRDDYPYSMDNSRSYGPVVVSRSMSWAQREGLLVQHDVYGVQVTDDDVHRVIEANPRLRVSNGAARARQIAAAVALAKTARQQGLGGIITYHSTVQAAQDFVGVLADVVDALPADQKPTGTLRVRHINGETPAAERSTSLKILDSSTRKGGDWSVVTNCNCLSEGVNVPSMDAVMFVDPRSSLVDIVQAVGRPLRRDRNRPTKRAAVIIPAFIGDAQTPEDALHSGAFDGVFQIVKALRDSDEALQDCFAENLARHASGDHTAAAGAAGASPAADVQPGERPLIGVLDADGNRVDEHGGHPFVTLTLPDGPATAWANWHAAFETAVLETATTSWDAAFAAWSDWQQANPGRLMPQSAVHHGIKVGQWQNTQQKLQRAGALRPDKEERMSRTAPRLFLNQIELAWETSFQLCADYLEENPGAALTHSTVYREKKIGTWIRNQVAAMGRGSLRGEKLARLAALDARFAAAPALAAA